MTRTRFLVFVIVLLVATQGWLTYKVLGASHSTSAQVKRIADEDRRIAAEGRRIGLERRFILQSCNRLNILRVEDNISHFADYRVFKIVLLESRALPPRPGQTAQEARFQRLFLDQLAQAVREKTWTPRTYCPRAVAERGPAFRAPHPIPFAELLPPKAALTLVPADFQPTSGP